MGLKVLRAGEVTVLKFESFEKKICVEHCFTARSGGCSDGEFKSLNMGMYTDDKLENVVENYRRVSRDVFCADVTQCVLSKQVHKTEIAVVSKEDMGNGVTKSQKYEEIDGLVTDEREVVLSTVYADCTPLFFVDPEKKVVGVAHAGWRGTVGKIGSKMVEIMASRYGSDRKDILVGIGPTIGSCCYTVKEDVASQFKKAFPDCSKILEQLGEGQYRLNLWEANKASVMESGVPESNIELDSHCTSCNEELFYSYRRDQGKTGRMAAMIKLK